MLRGRISPETQATYQRYKKIHEEALFSILRAKEETNKKITAEERKWLKSYKRILSDTLKARKAFNQQELKEIINTKKAELQSVIRMNQQKLKEEQKSAQQTLAFVTRMSQQRLKEELAAQKSMFQGMAVLQRTYPQHIAQVERLNARVQAGTLTQEKANRIMERYNGVVKSSTKDTSLFGRAVSSLVKSFKTLLSYTIAGSGVFLIVGAFKGATQAIFEYDQALKNLQAITSASDQETKEMGGTIKLVAATTKFSIKEVSDAMILLGQSGFTAQESIDSIQAVANLATGTLSDLASTSDLITTSIRAFGLQASEAAMISDVFANAVNKSKLTIDKIRTSFNYVAPVAYKAGLSIQETSAAMMILANSGIRASTIGTGLRQAISRLIAPSIKLQKAFKDSGADMSKLNPLTNDFVDVVGELQKVVKTSAEAFELFGLRGAPAILALTTAGTTGFLKMQNATERMGTAADMAKLQLTGLQASLKQLQDKAQTLSAILGESGLQEVFRGLLFVARELMDVLIAFAESTLGKMVIRFALITAGVGALTAAVYGSIVAFNVSVLAVAKLGAVMLVTATSSAALTKGLGLLGAVTKALPLIGAIALITSLVSVLWSWKEAKDANIAADESELKKGKEKADQISRELKTLKEYRDSLFKYSSEMRAYADDYDKYTVSLLKHESVIGKLINAYPEWGVEITNASSDLKELTPILDEIKSKSEETQKSFLKMSVVGLSLDFRDLEKEIEETGKGITKLEVLQNNFNKESEQYKKIEKELHALGLKKLKNTGELKGKTEELLPILNAMLDAGIKYEDLGWDGIYKSFGKNKEATYALSLAVLKHASDSRTALNNLANVSVTADAKYADSRLALFKKLSEFDERYYKTKKGFLTEIFNKSTLEGQKEFIDGVSDIEENIIKMSEKEGYSPEMMTAETVKEFETLLKKVSDINTRAAGEFSKIQAEMSAKLESLETDKRKIIEAGYDKEIADIAKFSEDKKKAIIAGHVSQQVIDEYVAEARSKALQEKNVKLAELDFDLAMQGIDLQDSINKAKLAKESEQASKDETLLKVIKKKELELEVKSNEDKLDALNSYYLQVKDSTIMQSDDIMKLEKDMADAQAALSNSRANLNKEGLKEEAKDNKEHLKFQLEEVRKHSAEWLKIWNEMYDAQLIKTDEWAKGVNAATESGFDAMMRGMTDAGNEMDSLQGDLYNFGKTVVEGVQRSLTEVFDNIATGAKTTKEIIQDLGKAILHEINSILAKQMTASLFGNFNQQGVSSGSSLLKAFSGFATGGNFKVGGTGGTDSQLVAFRASPGEEVNISRPGESNMGSIVVNVTVPPDRVNNFRSTADQIGRTIAGNIGRAQRRNG